MAATARCVDEDATPMLLTSSSLRFLPRFSRGCASTVQQHRGRHGPMTWTAIAACVVWLAGCSSHSPASTAAPVAAAAQGRCDALDLTSLALDAAAVTSVAWVDAGSYSPPGTTDRFAGLPAFCRVLGTASPTTDSLIHFELWVPQGGAWNGKLVATGNGGYSSALSYGDMAYAMRQGYATLGGDTGHQTVVSGDLTWGVGHPEKIVDWGTRSINAITVPGKRIVAALQGKDVSRSYYYGCSTGGHQAYAEVQRYPQDFDGVIAGAPANNWVALSAEALWKYRSNRTADRPDPILTPEKAQWLNGAAIAACDALDGVTDGIIDDPRACTAERFNVEALQCKGADAANCLTAPQVAAVKRLYQGATNPRTGAPLYPGPVPGTETGWPSYWRDASPARLGFWGLWSRGTADWSAWSFDFDLDYADTLNHFAGLVDQVDPDIAAFKARGGKLITYQGWADPVIGVLDTIGYYDKVTARQGSLAQTQSFFRLFVVPGMGHCGGGDGANVFGNAGEAAPVITPQTDLLMALDRWVERGTAPDDLIASKVTDGTVTGTRPLCAYPRKAVYAGTGSTEDAASFSCR
jgi:feruloyl esterase